MRLTEARSRDRGAGDACHAEKQGERLRISLAGSSLVQQRALRSIVMRAFRAVGYLPAEIVMDPELLLVIRDVGREPGEYLLRPPEEDGGACIDFRIANGWVEFHVGDHRLIINPVQVVCIVDEEELRIVEHYILNCRIECILRYRFVEADHEAMIDEASVYQVDDFLLPGGKAMVGDQRIRVIWRGRHGCQQAHGSGDGNHGSKSSHGMIVACGSPPDGRRAMCIRASVRTRPGFPASLPAGPGSRSSARGWRSR